jgi:ferredoxin
MTDEMTPKSNTSPWHEGEQAWSPEQGSLLDFAEAHGLSPAYGCRAGGCGSCAVRLKAGAVTYRTKPDFPVDPEQVLICCAVPAKGSETLELEL